MRLDIEDVLSDTFSRGVMSILFFISAIWFGSMIGGLAWLIGNERSFNIFELDLSQTFHSLLLLINLWIVPNVAFLAIMLIRVFVNDDGMSHMTWGVIIGMESLFVMLGWCLNFSSDPKGSLIAWSTWLLLLGMIETGVWLHAQMRRNRWARAMVELSAENAMLRAQRAAATDADATESPDLK